MKQALVLFLFLHHFIYAQEQDERDIRLVLSNQEECWNAGDIECYMDGYWKSDRLIFIGSSGVTYGWQATLDNYKIRYPDKEAMGILTFEILQMEPLSDDFWSVIGKYRLQRAKDNPSGYFTLLFRRLGNDWVIVSDHTS